MKRTTSKTLCATLLATAGLLGAGASHATLLTGIYSTGPGLGLDIPDNDISGISSTINVVPGENFMDTVPDMGALLLGVEVGVSLDHTYVGDLIITLEGPNGDVITLLDRPGVPDLGDFGDSSDLTASLPLLFGDRAQIGAEAVGAGCGDNQVIGVDCGRAFAPEESLEAFVLANINLLGDWTLTVSDNAGQDLGTLNGWYIELDFAPVPIPAGVWLLISGLAGLGLARKKRG